MMLLLLSYASAGGILFAACLCASVHGTACVITFQKFVFTISYEPFVRISANLHLNVQFGTKMN